MLPKPTTHRYRCIAAAVALTLVVLMNQAAFALEVPPLRAHVNDLAGMLSQGVARQLELLLKDFEQKDSTQIVVLTVSSLEGAVLEEFSMRVAETWRVGHKGLDNGA
ncbi:MAG: TPM domain-containing protein, partial [Desulfuromonadaceae bacterium]